MHSDPWPRQEAHPTLLRGNRVSTCGHLYMNRGGYLLSADRTHTGALIHRAHWEAVAGPIPDGFMIHHIDENRTNNDIDNLACVSPGGHCWLHKRG